MICKRLGEYKNVIMEIVLFNERVWCVIEYWNYKIICLLNVILFEVFINVVFLCVKYKYLWLMLLYGLFVLIIIEYWIYVKNNYDIEIRNFCIYFYLLWEKNVLKMFFFILIGCCLLFK